MKTAKSVFAFALVAGLTLAGRHAVAAAPPRYTFQMFTPTSGGEDNIAADLNALGAGTGRMFSGSTTGDRALVLQNGATQKLGILPSTGDLRYSEGRGINDLGDIVGESSFTGNGVWRGFLYADGTMQNLGTLGGANSSAYAVNNARQVVGRSATASGGFEPFLWQNGTMISLGSLGGNDGTAFSINQSGAVVGDSRINANDDLAFYYSDRNGNGSSDPGEMINLGTLPDFRESVAWSINDLGEVVGTAINGSLTRGFYWSDANGNHLSDPGEMVQLPTLFDTNLSYPKDINSAGDIVGYSRNPSFNFTPTLWTDGGVYDLSTLIDLLPGQTMPTFDTAVSINDAGQILLSGKLPSPLGNRTRVFLLTPVPEPATGVLAVFGLVGLLVMRCCGRSRSGRPPQSPLPQSGQMGYHLRFGRNRKN
jgi:probable HAF family extracellular repeat protein